MASFEKRIAIVPGSFDPITYGHVDIAKRASELYDEVYLAVMINRKKNYMFSMEQRKKIAEAALREIKNIHVISSEGMLWELAKALGACAIVKGYRNETDLAYEKNMAVYNEQHYPNAKTVLLPSEEAYTDISSTAVRAKILEKGDLTDYLPPSAIEEIYKIIPRHL